MSYHKTILILEDNLHVLSALLERLYQLEGDQSNELSVMILTNSEQVAMYVNTNPLSSFDLVILDRDDKVNKSFHILDIERLGVEKVISISTVSEYNEELRKRGVTRVVEKDLRNIDDFAQKVVKEVEDILASAKKAGKPSWNTIHQKLVKSIRKATLEDIQPL